MDQVIEEKEGPTVLLFQPYFYRQATLSFHCSNLILDVMSDLFCRFKIRGITLSLVVPRI